MRRATATWCARVRRSKSTQRFEMEDPGWQYCVWCRVNLRGNRTETPDLLSQTRGSGGGAAAAWGSKRAQETAAARGLLTRRFGHVALNNRPASRHREVPRHERYMAVTSRSLQGTIIPRSRTRLCRRGPLHATAWFLADFRKKSVGFLAGSAEQTPRLMCFDTGHATSCTGRRGKIVIGRRAQRPRGQIRTTRE